MSKLSTCLAFVAGIAIGSGVTWKYLKTEYERKTQEEIDSVKEVFARRNEESAVETTVSEEEPEEATELEESVELMTELGYVQDDVVATEEVGYVITPEEFGEFDDYEGITLTLYSDGVLADDNDDLVDDVDATLGNEWPDKFDEYEDDVVFVRNDRLRCDYEICKDLSTYEEATGR